MTAAQIDGVRIPPFVAALRELYVDPTNGDDRGAGTMADPLLTLQEAVNRFLPLWFVQVWAHNDNRVINIVGSGHTITEQVVVPDFAGMGVLHFSFEEQVVHAGLQLSGAPAGIAGFEVAERVSFDTSPMTPSTLGDNSFYRPDATAKAAAGYDDIIEETFEDVAILDNAAGTIDVVADVGTTIFGYVLGADGDVVRPQNTWSPDRPASSLFANAVAIKTGKGRVLVTGCAFDFEDNNDTAVVTGDQGNAGGTQNVTLARCTFTNQGAFGNNGLVRGLGAGLHACIDLSPAFGATFSEVPQLLLNNCRFAGGGVRFSACTVDLSAISSDDIVQFEASIVGFVAVDTRNSISAGIAYELRCEGANQGIFAASFGVSSSTVCVQLNESSHVRLNGANRLQGSGSFAGVGIYRNSYFELIAAATMPLAGPAAGNDFQTGGAARAAWTSVAAGANAHDTAGDRSTYYRIS